MSGSRDLRVTFTDDLDNTENSTGNITQQPTLPRFMLKFKWNRGYGSKSKP